MSDNLQSSDLSHKTVEELLKDFARVDGLAKEIQTQLADIEQQLAQRGIPLQVDASGKDSVKL
jgi:hypothetical protein